MPTAWAVLFSLWGKRKPIQKEQDKYAKLIQYVLCDKYSKHVLQ